MRSTRLSLLGAPTGEGKTDAALFLGAAGRAGPVRRPADQGARQQPDRPRRTVPGDQPPRPDHLAPALRSEPPVGDRSRTAIRMNAGNPVLAPACARRTGSAFSPPAGMWLRAA